MKIRQKRKTREGKETKANKNYVKIAPFLILYK